MHPLNRGRRARHLALLGVVAGCSTSAAPSSNVPVEAGSGAAGSAGSGGSGAGGRASLAGASGNGPGPLGTGGVGGTRSATAGGSSGASAPGFSGGGAGTGGIGAGGTSGSAGSGGTGTPASYFIGADITDQEPAPAAAQDDLLSQLKAHGFNFIRLRTFVDPRANDGYDPVEGYGDIAHTVTFGRKIKVAGMGLLIDFHYSDNWADPGKQCIPIAWQGHTTIETLATAVHDYTKDAIQKLVAGGARPDMVQIGNETTPGLLLHHCDSGGHPLSGQNISVTGSTGNWTNLGKLLKAGIAGVREVDSSIAVSFHIDRGDSFSATKYWIDNAVAQGAVPDAFGESCYQKYQGDPNSVTNTVNGWTSTFSQLVDTYPSIEFLAAEYGGLERQINDVLFQLPNQHGIGTFAWEPTTNGAWNQDPQNAALHHSLLLRSGSTYAPQPDLALFDAMKSDYASRL